MIRWQRGPRRSHEADPADPPSFAEHWTAWEGNQHIGSVVQLDDNRWSLHLRKVGGGWLDGPCAFGDVEQAKRAFVAWVEYGGAA